MHRRTPQTPVRPFVIGHSSLVIPRRNRRGGFALLITITLLAFLVLLLVSLAALTRVETQVANNNQQIAQARQNALMALNIAVGQLQKYAGPDQRTTARADLQNDPNNSATTVKTNAHWTGVYGNSVQADYSQDPVAIASALNTAGNINVTTGSPARLLNWLVSGNEEVTFNPTWSGPNVGDKGQIITASTNIPFTPNRVIGGNFSATTAATATDLTIAETSGTRDAVLLVGKNSVTSSMDSVASNAKPIDYVVAPTVDIKVPASSVPGMGAAGDVTVGRYAWWVGDEGVKARVNLPLAGSQDTLTGTEKIDELRHGYVNTTRSALELMASTTPNWQATPPALDAARIGTLFNSSASDDPPYGDHETLSTVIANSQLPLLPANNTATWAGALKYRFHDITQYSNTVLSDTYAGGLKRDLGALLDSTYTPPSGDPTEDDNTLWVRHPDATSQTYRGYTDNYGIPTWKHLRSYYQTRVPPSRAMAPILPAHDKNTIGLPANLVPDHVGIAPILTYYSLGWSVGLKGNPGQSNGSAASAGDEIHVRLHPMVVLWNPYNFTLTPPTPAADGSHFEAGVYPTYNVVVRLWKKLPSEPYWRRETQFDFQRNVTPATSTNNDYKFIRFRIKLPAGGIPPGQSIVFCLPVGTSGLYTQNNILEPSEPEPDAYVSVPFRNSGANSAAIQPGEETAQYQVNSRDGNSSSLNNGGAGGIFTYLGEPDPAGNMLARDYRLSTGSVIGGDRPLYNPSANGSHPSQTSNFPKRRWYNTHQSIDWTNTQTITGTMPTLEVLSNPYQPDPNLPNYNPAVDRNVSIFREPNPFVYESNPEPDNLFLSQALFSGAGQNAQLFSGQYMYTTRWIAQSNIRATRTGRTMRDANFNVLYVSSAGSTAKNVPWQKFVSGAGDRVSAGQGHDWINNRPVDAVLFEFPSQNEPLFSIGQLQHANLSFFGGYPAYPIGNSMANFRLPEKMGSNFTATEPPDGYQIARIDRGIQYSGGEFQRDMNAFYDISYLLNRNLWDRYYFSTVPAGGTTPANPRLKSYDTAVNLSNPDQSAAGLMLAGGFNINSTSEQAWRAVLGGGNQLRYDPENPNSSTASAQPAAFPRFARPLSDTNSGIDPNDPWQRNRTLDENQIAQLARNIVSEIRSRGPFISLADFVNRRIYDNKATPAIDLPGFYSGPLQSAIDKTITSGSGSYPANDPASSFWSGDELAKPAVASTYHNQSNQYSFGNYSRLLLEGGTTPTKPSGARSAFAPAYLTQGDILAKIGASLTGRSDTFTVRSYGETRNPATGEINGRAWCEALVQRVPEFVEPATNPWATPSATNQKFGRKFKIISFRWLTSEDI